MSCVYTILKLTRVSATNMLHPDDELLDNIIAHDQENRETEAEKLTDKAQYVSF